MGHLLECVKLYGKFINKNENKHMLRCNIAATLLKTYWKNLYSVKCYVKSNMNVFTLSLWENCGRGLIYFDQFICIFKSFFWEVTGPGIYSVLQWPIIIMGLLICHRKLNLRQ